MVGTWEEEASLCDSADAAVVRSGEEDKLLRDS